MRTVPTYPLSQELQNFGCERPMMKDAFTLLTEPDWIPDFLTFVKTMDDQVNEVVSRKIGRAELDRRLQSEVFHCDKHAVKGMFWANYSRLIADTKDPSGIAFGCADIILRIDAEFLGLRGPGAHCTNVCKCDDGEWYFVELQTYKYEKVRTILDAGAISLWRWTWL